jgi:hypothetical protein
VEEGENGERDGGGVLDEAEEGDGRGDGAIGECGGGGRSSGGGGHLRKRVEGEC